MRYFLATFVSIIPFILASKSFAQEIVWAKQSEPSIEYEGAWTVKIEVDQYQNVYVLYVLQGKVRFENEDYQSQGYSDILLIKYNGEGNILWRKQIGGLGADYGADLTIDHSNQVLITGSFSDEVDFLGQTLIKENGSAFFAKIDSSGELVWVMQYGTENAGGESIAVDGNNNVLVGGLVDWYALTISKYDTNGILIWSNSFTQNGCCLQPSITDIKCDSQNNIILGGDFFGYFNYSGELLGYTGYFNAYIFKLDGNGQSIWFNRVAVHDSPLNESRSIALDIDGLSNVYFIGYFDDNATFGNITLQKKHDIDDRSGFLTKINPQGNFEWATAMYGLDMIPGSIKVNRNSNEISISGSSPQWFEYDDDYVSSKKGMQSFVLSTDMNGQFKRNTFINSESYPSYQFKIAFNSLNEFYVAGNFNADFKAGCTQLNGSNLWSTAFLIKAGKIPVIEINELNTQCLNGTTRVVVTGADEATKFVWSFPEGIESLDGSFETIDPFINIKIVVPQSMIPFTVTPYFNCYAQADYPSILIRDSGPAKPGTPVGPEILCYGSASLYWTIQKEDVSSYHWVLSDNLSFSIDGSVEVDITASAPSGVGTIRVMAVNACGESEVSEPLIVTINPKPSIPDITGPSEVCAGQRGVKFAASSLGAQSYGWVIPSDIEVNSFETDSISIEFNFPENKSQVTIQAIAKGFCESEISNPFIVTIHPKPSIPVITGPTEVCAGQKTVKFTASSLSTQSYGWIIPLDLGVNEVKTDSVSIEFNFPENKNQITIQAIAKGFCENAISEPYQINITMSPIQPTSIEGEPRICNGDKDVTYTVLPLQQNVVFEWAYPSGFVINEASSNHISFSATESAESGIVSVVVSNKCFTTTSTLLIVTVYKKPVKPIIYKDKCDRSIRYEGDNEFVWYKDSTPLITEVGNTLFVSDSGYYNLETHNYCGVEFAEEILVVPVIESEIFIPNVVTSNQDGKNDFFVIDKSLQNSTLEIFNRWGNLIYESRDYDNSWSGIDLSYGIYYYILKNQCLTEPISGSIHLLK